jgi:hypothetical protein
MQNLEVPSLLPLVSFLAPIFGLLVKRYGNRLLARCERVFRGKPLPRAERRRRERARRKRS